MNRRSTRLVALGLSAGLAAVALAGCAPSSGDGEGDGVTITWWHNATSGPLPAVWEEVANEFEEAHPGVTVEQTGYQNEELQRTLIPNALASGDAPDLFQVWPGGELRDQVENDYLMPLDDAIPDTISSVGATVNPWQVDGATYGIPFTFGIEGFWYNTDQFAEAGIDAPPTTLDELVDDVAKLRAAGFTPIAVGAGDKWPAAHWWYQFALHSCSPETLQAAETEYDFGDDWDHVLAVEAVLDEPPAEVRCTGGRMACPPEDCGGIWGYTELAAWVRGGCDPSSVPPPFDDAGHARDWLPLDWHPDRFDVDEANTALAAAVGEKRRAASPSPTAPRRAGSAELAQSAAPRPGLVSPVEHARALVAGVEQLAPAPRGGAVTGYRPHGSPAQPLSPHLTNYR